MYSDAQLISEIQNGNSALFKIIVERYQSLVAATVAGMLGNTVECEDVGQETFIRLYKNLANFRGESSLGTYITRIAINLSLNEIKRRKRHKFFSFEDEWQGEKNKPESGESWTDVKEHVQNAIVRLPEKFRSVVVLRLMDGYTTRETAEILQLPLGTVLSRLARAQEKLRLMLQPLMEENV